MSAWTVVSLAALTFHPPTTWTAGGETPMAFLECPNQIVFLVDEQWPEVGHFRTEDYFVFDANSHGRIINIYPAWRGQAGLIEIEELKLRIELPEGPDPCIQ